VSKIDKKNRFKVSVIALSLALGAMPLMAHAAGLGRLSVTSALGQPLRAEIDLTATRDEYGSMSARIASVDAFKNAGIEYSPALAGVRLSLDKRPDGQLFVSATSDRPFNEPFVDMLVEVNWASGRLVREYTFLLDPPEFLNKSTTSAPIAVPEVKTELPPVAAVPSKKPEPVVAAVPEARFRSRAEEALSRTPPAEEPKPAKKLAGKPLEAGATRQVKKGDTLAKIANEIKPEGVSLDQMLVALFRSNQEVFDAGNMNRLGAGKILTLPDMNTARAIDQREARKIVVAQSADFNAYRKRLAAHAAAQPAKEEMAKQAAAGRITPKVEENVPPATGKDKLEVSRAEAGKDGKLGARVAAAEEDLVARDKALKDANSRVAQLEKNLADLKKLAEMKSAAGGKLEESAKPSEGVMPSVPVKPVTTPSEVAPPAAKLAVPPPPPPPGFVEENPEIVFGGGAIIALLLGYLGFGAWRRKRQAAAADIADNEFPSAASASTTGESIDTGSALPTDFSQEGQGAVSADEGVDPVAEADVYMAYGRDSQAEEILLEALKTDPTRCAIHLKLLEIYAARKSAQPFEAVARDLHGLTGGYGTDWEKAAALGRSIDSSNPLYGGVAPAVPDIDLASSTVIMQAQDIQAPAAAEEPVAPVEQVPESLDFDLDLDAGSAPAAIETSVAETPSVEAPVAEPSPEDEVMSLDFDLDLGAPPEPEVVVEAIAEPEPAGLDFDIGPAVAEPEPAELAIELPTTESDEVAPLDFDFDLGQDDAVSAEAPVPAVMPEMPLDLSALSLDLDEAPVPVEAPAMPEAVVEDVAIEDDPEVATKLELAQAYDEMGDKEGARELLNEVLNEGSPSQQGVARVRLAQLG